MSDQNVVLDEIQASFNASAYKLTAQLFCVEDGYLRSVWYDRRCPNCQREFTKIGDVIVTVYDDFPEERDLTRFTVKRTIRVRCPGCVGK
jgi:hypothetical protein